MKKLPNKPGPIHIKISDYIDEIFEIAKITSKSAPNILRIKTKKRFIDIYEGEHKTKTFIWNNEKGATVGYLSYVETPGRKTKS